MKAILLPIKILMKNIVIFHKNTPNDNIYYW